MQQLALSGRVDDEGAGSARTAYGGIDHECIDAGPDPRDLRSQAVLVDTAWDLASFAKPRKRNGGERGGSSARGEHKAFPHG